MYLRSVFAALFTLALAAPAAHALEPISGDVVGAVISYKAQKNENLSSIAMKFGVGYVELQAANPGVNPSFWLRSRWLASGTEITVGAMHLIPSEFAREGVVVNLETSRLFYFKDGKQVMTFPIASGKSGWETPTGVTKVYNKRKDPIWTPPPRIRAESPDLPDFIPAGPNNPLGKYAISVGFDGIMFHGTNSPSSVGKKVSHGCMRMYAKDIERLYKAVSIGTPVILMKSSHEIGWQGDTMFLQMAPKVKKAKWEEARYAPNLDLYEKIQKAAGPSTTINWRAVEETVWRADGIPVAIGTRPAQPPQAAPMPLPATQPADATSPVGPANPAAPQPERRASLEVIGSIQ